MVNLTEAEVQYIKSDSNWTNDAETGITTTIQLNTDKNVEGYTIQYTKFAEGEEVTSEKLQNAQWQEYSTSGILSKENETIYSRLYDGTNATSYTSTTIANIDTTIPTISTELTSTDITENGFSLNIGVTDEKSGLGKIEWYYKIDGDTEYTKVEEEYTPIKGNVKGETTATNKKKTFTNLENGIYNAYAIVYDVAGNSEKSETIEINVLSIYSVTFNGNNVTSDGANTVIQNSEYIANLTPTTGYEISAITVKMGDTILAENTGYTYANGKITVPNVSGNIEITATTGTIKYTVSFDANGGNTQSDISVEYNGTYQSLPTPTRTGYTFAGWFTSETDNNGTGTQVTVTSKVTNADHTLYAKWNIVYYNITYTMNSGTNSSSNPTKVAHGTKVTLVNPTRSTCSFTGWYNGSTKVTEVTVTSDITLTANWEHSASCSGQTTVYHDVTYDVDKSSNYNMSSGCPSSGHTNCSVKDYDRTYYYMCGSTKKQLGHYSYTKCNDNGYIFDVSGKKYSDVYPNGYPCTNHTAIICGY